MRFHFWGGKKDGSRVREILNRLVQRGRLGNISLVTTHLAVAQEPTLLLQVSIAGFINYIFIMDLAGFIINSWSDSTTIHSLPC